MEVEAATKALTKAKASKAHGARKLKVNNFIILVYEDNVFTVLNG